MDLWPWVCLGLGGLPRGLELGAVAEPALEQVGPARGVSKYQHIEMFLKND